ncbi:hypothetical protein E2C01_033224 [Portunus trituberculatus]|uniref:Endonuclease/exonuclease/phosphatase domain-containing protein n=1 Tax=Portunus trituberculatus TaxID=210409 RepID=A0A5B7F370_PORTR|nr:hypothetical protein [Portunus trituberculatus]
MKYSPSLGFSPSISLVIDKNFDAANTRQPQGPPKLRVLQWNVQGLRPKKHQVLQAVFEENLDVVLLQETLTPAAFEWRVAGYTLHSLPAADGTRGCAVLVRSAIPHSQVAAPVHCDDGVVLALELPVGSLRQARPHPGVKGPGGRRRLSPHPPRPARPRVGTPGRQTGPSFRPLSTSGGPPTSPWPTSTSQQERDLTEAIQRAADATIPRARSCRHQPDCWFYNEERPRADGVLLQCVRLGFCTKEELYDSFEGQECEHCGRQSRRPLLHYLLSCPATATLRPPPPLPIQPAAGSLLSRRAVWCLPNQPGYSKARYVTHAGTSTGAFPRRQPAGNPSCINPVSGLRMTHAGEVLGVLSPASPALLRVYEEAVGDHSERARGSVVTI